MGPVLVEPGQQIFILLLSFETEVNIFRLESSHFISVNEIEGLVDGRVGGSLSSLLHL